MWNQRNGILRVEVSLEGDHVIVIGLFAYGEWGGGGVDFCLRIPKEEVAGSEGVFEKGGIAIAVTVCGAVTDKAGFGF